ncbi:hypothetical protein [Demequina maris]|uniref:hypothetical protein n=1 Tax=Demequina maris TaxID=1638982 RepID=UPI000785BAA1|nr:hypothetical protein [Demequina maris]
MRIHHGAMAVLTAAAAGLALTACTSGSDSEVSAAASSATDAISAAAVNVSGIVDDVRTASECGSWAGGKMAGEGVVAGWQYTCDEDGDGVPEATVSIYLSQDDADSDLATVEAASSDTGIATGDHFIFTTTDADQLAAIADLGGEVVREVP